MSSFTSSVKPEEYNDDQEPRGKPAHWDKRIRSIREERSAAQQALKEAIESQQSGLEGLQAARSQLLKLFGRIERLGDQIDAAFGGQAFLQELAPTAPANRRRFKIYFEEHSQVTGLLMQALEAWMLTCGLKREDNWVPLLLDKTLR